MKTNCRIHLSSAPVFVREDSDVCSNDVEPPHMRSTDYSDLQKLSLDLCSLGFLDSCLSLSPLNALLNPSQVDITTPGSPVSFFPVVSDMLLIPVLEHNDRNAHLVQDQKPEWVLDGREVHHSSASVTRISPRSWGPPDTFETQPLAMHKEVPGMFGPLVPDGMDPNKLVNVLSEVEVKHHQLHSQVCGLHDNPGEVPLHSYEHGAIAPLQGCSTPHLSWKDLSAPPPSLTGVGEFAHSSQVVLRGLQESLDSEETVSSSSEEEPEDFHSLLSWEMQHLEERAELSSRWSWLQLRLADLKGRIQQMDELQKHLRSTKAKVVLAESQPLTSRRAQHTLMRDRTGFSCTASDSDAEPCSPTRLLCSIERQSAQLSQIVKSLLPPLNCSPLSKQAATLTGSSAFQRSRSGSGQRGGEVFHSDSSRRSRLVTRRPVKVVKSCARTRPAVALHKRKLFIFNCEKDFSLQDSVDSLCGISSLSSCFHASSGEPATSDVSCTSSSGVSSSSFCSGAPSSSSDSLACQQLQRLREEWSQRPLVINTEVFSPLGCRRSSTPMTRHKYRSHLQNPGNKALDLSPIRSSGYNLGRSNKPQRRRRRRKGRTCICAPVEDMDVLHHHCFHGDGSIDMPEESYTQVSCSNTSQTFLHKDHRHIIYHFNDGMIPSSSHRLEKLQYKEIPTPRWRVVQMESLSGAEMERDEEKLQVENLTDDVFAQRHLLLEQKEKSRWGCRRPASWLSGSGKCTSGEESCGQPDQLLPLEERATPWEPRLFPLTEAECADLLDEEEHPPEWADSTSCTLLSNPEAPISPYLKSCCQRVQHCPLVDKEHNNNCPFT